jgi:hypothetical protein
LPRPIVVIRTGLVCLRVVLRVALLFLGIGDRRPFLRGLGFLR